ncbi:Crp/Fnr family transcriptional regulator [Deinococcus detaillensis]|uniref:Crp/Fnr family transcriptional regulator n=1 Tax=Deinococcus detaillensis TaxID=2592048 RepID=A0A553V536_9DEIO|nr:Crp/Fnr family transcriptional regulator [Deinococcus detaillensis]TSA87331.1 Crp/Fnr family transcriptional regulator [Deinococcus detaillensis]
MLPGFLAALPEAARVSLLSTTRQHHWSRGSIVLHADDPAETLYMLQSGHARLYRLGASAREVTVNVHGPGDLLGLTALLDNGKYGLYAEAMDDLSALMIGGEALRDLMSRSPDLSVALSTQVVRQTRGLQDRLSQLVFLEVSQRLALALLELANESGENHDQQVALRGRISHQDLAHAVGSTRETITKLLGEFRSRGLLDLGYRRIVVMDRGGLEKAARQPLGA